MAKRRPKFGEVGQGLAAVLGNINIETPKTEDVKKLANTVLMLPVGAIVANKQQPRKDFNDESLEELAASISVHGLIQPITVRLHPEEKNKYQIISGERRYRASKLAKLKEIPSYVLVVNDQVLLEMALIENIQREDLNPIEISWTYQRLIKEHGLTHKQLSERVGKNRSTITNSLRLLTLPPDILAGLKEGEVTAGQVRPLAGMEDIAIQLMIYREIIEKSLSSRQVEDLKQAYLEKAGAKPNSTKKPKLDPSYRKVQDDLSRHFESKVALKRKPTGNGQIVINFKDDHDLNRLLDVLNL